MAPLSVRLALVAFAALAACTPASDADAAAVGAPAGPPPAVAAVLAVAPGDSLAALSPETAAAYARITSEARAQGIASKPYGEIVQWVGEQLRGRPYVAGMLDAPPRETLLADLTRFDCVLFVENVLAIAHTIALEDTTPDAYLAQIARMRYRGGDMAGYCSRLHYFSDWIADNDARGVVHDVTAEAGGVPFDKRIDFMSTHRASYPHLRDDATYACATAAEGRLAGVQLIYIPKANIRAAYAQMQPGDVVAMATSIGGLDVTHTGFIHVGGGRTGFMHASSASNEVKISPDLSTYVRDIRNQVGIIIARPVDPRQAHSGQ